MPAPLFHDSPPYFPLLKLFADLLSAFPLSAFLPSRPLSYVLPSSALPSHRSFPQQTGSCLPHRQSALQPLWSSLPPHGSRKAYWDQELLLPRRKHSLRHLPVHFLLPAQALPPLQELKLINSIHGMFCWISLSSL